MPGVSSWTPRTSCTSPCTNPLSPLHTVFRVPLFPTSPAHFFRLSQSQSSLKYRFDIAIDHLMHNFIRIKQPITINNWYGFRAPNNNSRLSIHFILRKLATQSQIIEMDNQDNGTVSIHLSLLLSKPTSITCPSVKWQDEHRPYILTNRHSPPFSHGLLVSTAMYLVHYSQLILTIPITRAITCNNQCNQCNQCHKDSRWIQAWSILYDLLRGSTMMLKDSSLSGGQLCISEVQTIPQSQP